LKCPRNARRELHYVFPNGDGNVENHANIVTRGLASMMIAGGVTAPDGDSVPKYSGIHACGITSRHGASIGRSTAVGITAQVVSEQLDHSTIAITADLYGHLFPLADDSKELAAAEGKFG